MSPGPRPKRGVWWLRAARYRTTRAIAISPVLGPDAATDLDRRMMARAMDLARDAAAQGEVPVGAVVFDTQTGQTLGEGMNRRERHADPSAHAEFTAILAAARKVKDWRLNHCSLAVTLEPCPMCAGLIVNARVGRLIYGADDPKAGAVRSLYSITGDRRLNHRPAVIGGVLAAESAQELQGFFAKLREKRKRP